MFERGLHYVRHETDWMGRVDLRKHVFREIGRIDPPYPPCAIRQAENCSIQAEIGQPL